MTQLANVNLDDKYTLTKGRIFLTGVQALARLPMMQAQRDRDRGLNTAAFISGYRGSPLGGFDQALWRAADLLKDNNIHFQPGVNEDLAATAVWGSQQVNLFPGARVDGVFSIWYGKGPGVDRTGDVFKHANAAGTATYGGVLALAGDDHTCKSSTLPHQSEFAFIDANIPVLNPSGVQEILDLGIMGWEMSRYCGTWVALKTIAETVDSSATVVVDPDRHNVLIPQDFAMPEGGLNIRWPDVPLDQEHRLHRHKIYAALAFARANGFNRVVIDSEQPRFGIATTGKSYLDVLQALEDLGIDEAEREAIGLRVYKIGMPWPLERDGVRHFAEGLEEVLVVEEKRAIIENQLKEQLYNWRPDVRPRVVGKFDEQGEWILPSNGELTPARVARVIADRIRTFFASEKISQRLAFLEAKEEALSQSKVTVQRRPHFCSGCPHNTSTRVPDGSLALAGIGCHYMAQWMDRNTETFTQMGGEGASWIGQAPFTDTSHVFVNIGDGTYFHSGILAIRAAVAAGVNVTYKLLVNDAVAMTGGQPVDGNMNIPSVAKQLLGEGVDRVVVVSDEPAPLAADSAMPAGVKVLHRDELPALQLKIRKQSGVSVIVYVQTCATEKRRRRKRGLLEEPNRAVVINHSVCEGCGDCGVQSNCLSVIPRETDLGRKRTIDQSACNKDFSCLKGFCPSFVVVKGGKIRKAVGQNLPIAEVLPEPELPGLDQNYGIVITGVGGTGVVTIGALLGMAAHVDQLGATVLDMTGLAQKYGAVVSYVKISRQPGEIKAVRVAAGGANVLLGCDSVVAAGFDALAKVDAGRTRVIVNNHRSATADFLSNPDLRFPELDIQQQILQAAGGDTYCDFFDATEIARHWLGNTIGANLLMVGFAWQKGLIPISREAIERAIELNGVAVKFNIDAFNLGRQLAHNRARMEPVETRHVTSETSVDELVETRRAFLADYQDEAYADRYLELVKRVKDVEQASCPGQSGLVAEVSRRYFQLLSYKDEYEVARLLSRPEFVEEVAEQFEGDYQLEFQLAPTWLSRPDPATGRPAKQSFGPWILPVLRWLARRKHLRGGRFDLFGYQSERREERRLIKEYEASVEQMLSSLAPHNHSRAVAWMNWPKLIRGFGPVKHANMEAGRLRATQLRDEFRSAQHTEQAA